MSIAGNLKTMDLAELLQWLSQSQKTGTLVINNGTIEKRLYLKEGRIISSSSTDPKEYLGRFLVSSSFITEKELAQAIQKQKGKKTLLGEILVTEYGLGEEDLNRVLRRKAEEGMYDIFTWTNGEFRFLQGELPAEMFIPLSLDLTAVLMEGARRVDEWNRLRSAIPDLHCVPVAMTSLEDSELPPAAQGILSLIDDQRSVEEIQEESHATAFFVCSVLYEQHKHGKIKIIKPRIVEVVKEVVKEVIKEVPVAAPYAPPQVIYATAPTAEGAPTAPPSYSPPPATGSAAQGAVSQDAAGQAAATPAAPDPPPLPENLEDLDPTQLDPNALLMAASQYISEHDFERAMRYLRATRIVRPGDRELENAVKSAEKQIRTEIERSGLAVNKVPKLTVAMDKLTGLNVSAQEGFILTRIDGKYDLKSILKISSMPDIDALIVFERLYKAGHIRF